jgi:hypothetical protein
MILAPDPLPSGDEWRCGAGKGADCCRYLVIGTKGFQCTRDHEPSLKRLLDTRNDMTASRLPTEEYPGCQLKVQA